MISLSVVTYNSKYNEIADLISLFVKSPMLSQIFLVDNSPTPALSNLALVSEKIQYIHNPSNPGFGAAHNIAIAKALETGNNYHFVVNPDVSFEGDVITPMVKYMETHQDVGMLMPQILNEDGTVQNLPKLLPSPLSVMKRKLKYPSYFYNKFVDRYELRFVDRNKIYEAPILSGCFTLLRLSAINDIGMYDDKFFMYFEDWDLSRRMHQKYKTVYFPRVSIIHGYESGANKSKRLFKIFVNSAISYFNKWGWFVDKERDIINKKALEQFK